MNVVTVDVPKTVTVTDNEIQVVEVAAQDEVVTVIRSGITHRSNERTHNGIRRHDHNDSSLYLNRLCNLH